MVANKMTGDKGILFTATYVTRFEEMENELKNQAVAPVASYMIGDPIERAKLWIQEEQQRMLVRCYYAIFLCLSACHYAIF